MCNQPPREGPVRREDSTSALCPACVLLGEALKLLDEYAQDLRAMGWPTPKYLRIEEFISRVRAPCMWAGQGTS